jgi:hypothetical protein
VKILQVKRKGEVFYVVVDDEVAERIASAGRSLYLNGAGYAKLRDEGGRQVYLHRWIMGCVKGDGKIVDHRNRDKLDNRKCNLRFVTGSESVMNRGFGWGKGYIRDGHLYKVRVARGGVTFDLGRWVTEAEAIFVRKWFLSGELTRERAGEIYTSAFREKMRQECP